MMLDARACGWVRRCSSPKAARAWRSSGTRSSARSIPGCNTTCQLQEEGLMAQARLEQRHSAAAEPAGGLDISIRSGSGSGRTLLSAFDHALQQAGVADFNLVTLSSIIPTGSRIRSVDAPLPGGHGDLLFCVRAQAFAEQAGDIAWAGLGWCVDETGGGLFVEHHGGSEESVIEQIELSLADMNAQRGGRYGPVQMAMASAHCTGKPVCALVLAAYRVSTWDEPEPEAPVPQRSQTAAHPVRAAANGHAATFRTSEPLSALSATATPA